MASAVAYRIGKMITQKRPLELATLLLLLGGLLSKGHQLREDKTDGTRRQGSSGLEAGRRFHKHGTARSEV